MRNKQSLVFLASSLFLLILAPITSEAISNPSTNINEVNREIVEESANDQATSAPSHSETLEQEPSLETTTTTDNHPAETDQSTATLEPSEQQKDDGTSATESVIVEPQPRMLAAPCATSLPDDLTSFNRQGVSRANWKCNKYFRRWEVITTKPSC